MTPVVLATEDALSEEVGSRLLTSSGLDVGLCLRKNGFGYLRRSLDKLINLSFTQPVMLITDLDRVIDCQTLTNDWFRAKATPENMLFCVAVREIESWLLADRDAMGRLMNKPVGRLPNCPDAELDPKATLLDLARRAPKPLADELVQFRNKQWVRGFGYNGVLCDWVRTRWSPDRAAALSPSLMQARDKLQAMRERL